MQNLTGFYGIAKNGKVRSYAKDKKLGWIALEDVADASVKILEDGPSKHNGKDYWFSTESLNIFEVTQIISEVAVHKFVADPQPPEQFLKDLGADKTFLDPYFMGVSESFKQVVDGRMGYLSDVRDDLPQLIGRKGMSLKEWAVLHKEELIKAAETR